MAKKTVFRVIGIIKVEDALSVISAASPYLQGGTYNRFMMGARKQDKELGAEELTVQRIQFDFKNVDSARDCRENLKKFFVEDKSDFE